MRVAKNGVDSLSTIRPQMFIGLGRLVLVKQDAVGNPLVSPPPITESPRSEQF